MLIQPLLPKSTLALALGLLLGTALPTARVFAQPLSGTIISVGDGDTIRVRTAAQTLTVRLACIDAPEMSQRPYGQASANRLKQLLQVGQAVSLNVVDKDRYGRTVAKIYSGSLSVNLTLVQEGQAAVYRQYLTGCPELRDRLLSAEASAKSRRLGLWAQSNPVMPWDYRKGAKSANRPARATNVFTAPIVRSRPNRDYNCSDFKTQAEAQRMFDAYPGDPFRLDRDHDEIACESLK